MNVVDHRHERDIAAELVGPAPYDPTWLNGQGRALDVDSTAVARLYGAARDGCDVCREDLLEPLGRDPAHVAALALWACTHVMDTFNDLPMEMLERGDPAFRRLARAYSDSTFRHGFEERELTDLHEVCLRLDPHALQPAAERALQVLLADSADPDLFGSLTGAYTPGDEDDARDYTVTRQIAAARTTV
ncbi:hypothetical protein [Streptomyces violaceusniger]|uniref:Uncharacterized protein n=1 Tax=Streptomyces violaceusniger (strain Tu 4113) TaxID=653045 RepID=G2PGN5_STRV4|nr:hypothetical protein [Streptomyces violaceusniger]AEM88531.1 hypothetical protein Strvi_9242 [Streptomyces violaceusniger Tu 4113]